MQNIVKPNLKEKIDGRVQLDFKFFANWLPQFLAVGLSQQRLTAIVSLTQEPVNWFVVQISWLFSTQGEKWSLTHFIPMVCFYTPENIFFRWYRKRPVT